MIANELTVLIRSQGDGTNFLADVAARACISLITGESCDAGGHSMKLIPLTNLCEAVRGTVDLLVPALSLDKAT